MIVTVVDNSGYILINCIEKEKMTDENICVNPLNNYSLVKPKWNFDNEKWTEGATQDEIKEWEESNKPKPKEPTETEILQKQLLETQNMLVELQYKLTNKDLEIK
ncbi:hypothetical protein FDF11_04590 [Clostridium botulinum]|nr:hypothetical protein [Clostridium botulinum]NFR12978.1 hypothetical protein [Clostridium botulinum]NFR43563.1 hypothetical protein [Clostridium botulinum]NFS49977.1 hypothetical protein [Clostridium botulinum]